MSKSTVAVVIPVYKENMTVDERKSLLQCLKILGVYPIIFACPEKLEVKEYQEPSDSFKSASIRFERFDDDYFKSIAGYNRLLLSKEFYSRFKAFEYILIYQLDAWVFKDELTLWCSKGFSYIGAPWLEAQDKATPDSTFMKYAGNGGFSLRKIKSFLEVINAYKIIKPPFEIMKEYQHFSLLLRFIRFPVILLRFLGLRNNSNYQRAMYNLNEDNYWTTLAPVISKKFKVAKAEEAISFAFETMPRRMFALNHNQLPFGCHAWAKWDAEFWKQYIS
jgi:hypothetical protein